jgi:tRNA 2-thiouridine synthesizing protein A
MTSPPVVDALGTYCPVPIRLLERALVGIPVGSTAILLADDPLVEIDLVAWCHAKRHELLSLLKDDGEYRAEVRRLQ